MISGRMFLAVAPSLIIQANFIDLACNVRYSFSVCVHAEFPHSLHQIHLMQRTCSIALVLFPCRSLLVQFLIILCMVGLDVGIQTGEETKNRPLIIANSVGLVVMAVWSWLAYRAVKHENRKLAWVLTVLLPIMYILPVVDITLGESRATAQCCMSALC